MRKKIFFSIVSISIVFFMVLKVKAAGNVTGLIWDGLKDASDKYLVGDIDPALGGMIIPAVDGPVTGYAWEGNNGGGQGGNLGWIDFDPKDNCTTGAATQNKYAADTCTDPEGNLGGVVRVGNSLKGYARFVGIAQEKAKGNAGGMNGWISFNDPNYQVTIKSDGKLQGSATSELGNLDFSNLQIPVALPPEITLTANPSIIYLASNETIASAKTDLSWTISGTPVTSCSATCTDQSNNIISCPQWSSISTTSSGSKQNIAVDRTTVKFTLTCIGNNALSSSKTAIVTVGCAKKTCGGNGANTSICSLEPLTFIQTSDGGNSNCQGCTSDDDCTQRQIGSWKEVAP